MLAEVWYLHGKTFAGVGNYKSARVYFLKSLAILEKYDDSFELGRLHLRLAEMEFIQENVQQASTHINLAKIIFQRIHSERGLLSYYSMMIRINGKRWEQNALEEPARFDSLLFFYKKVESLAGKLKDTVTMAGNSLQFGNFLVYKNPLSAINHLNRALELYAGKNITGTAYAYVGLVPAYIYTKQYKLAFQALTEVNDFSKDKKINDLDLQIMIFTNYVLYFRTTGDWQKAFEFLQKLNILEQNRIIADRNGAITRLNMEFQSAKKEKLLMAQQQEIILRNDNLKAQQYFSWMLAALLLTASGTGFIFFRLYRKNQQTSRWNSELLQEQNHRVKNNLQVISSLLHMQSKRLTDTAAKKAVEETRLRVESMAILHRRLYDGEKFAKVNLDEFIPEVVEGVLTSYGYDHIRPTFEISNITLNADKAVRLGLILNELSTNACKYAFPFTELPKFSIQCLCVQNKLKLLVCDNGAGIINAATGQDKNGKKGAFGLSLIQTQVVQLNGNSQFNFSDRLANTGTEFTLEFRV